MLRDTLLKFFDIYVTLAGQLFEAWAESHQEKRPVECDYDKHNYEWLYETQSYKNDNCDKLVMLFDKQWDWEFHGEHCCFRCLDSDDKTVLEAHFYNYNIVDSGFFANFLLTYPPAIKSVSGIEIDFDIITNLLESYANDGYLHQIIKGGVNFIRL